MSGPGGRSWIPLIAFSENFCDLLAERGVMLKELADRTGIKVSRLYDFRNRKHLPSLENACKLADFFCCSLDYLCGLRPEYGPRTFVRSLPIHTCLREAVDKSELSRYQLSKRTGLSQSQLSDCYNGKTEPSLASLILLAEHLECSLDFLAGREETPDSPPIG